MSKGVSMIRQQQAIHGLRWVSVDHGMFINYVWDAYISDTGTEFTVNHAGNPEEVELGNRLLLSFRRHRRKSSAILSAMTDEEIESKYVEWVLTKE